MVLLPPSLKQLWDSPTLPHATVPVALGCWLSPFPYQPAKHRNDQQWQSLDAWIGQSSWRLMQCLVGMTEKNSRAVSWKDGLRQRWKRCKVRAPDRLFRDPPPFFSFLFAGTSSAHVHCVQQVQMNQCAGLRQCWQIIVRVSDFDGMQRRTLH